MRKGRSTISKAKSYKEIADFWDTHDLSDFWGQTKKVEFGVDIKSEIIYYSPHKKLAEKVQSIAQRAVYPLTRLLIYGFRRSFENRLYEFVSQMKKNRVKTYHFSFCKK